LAGKGGCCLEREEVGRQGSTVRREGSRVIREARLEGRQEGKGGGLAGREGRRLAGREGRRVSLEGMRLAGN